MGNDLKRCKKCGELRLRKNSVRTVCDKCMKEICFHAYSQLKDIEFYENAVEVKRLIPERKYGIPIRFCTDIWILN